MTNEIHALKKQLKHEMYRFIEKFQPEVLIPQNILTIPVHIPLGLAATEVIAEPGRPTIAPHHDFALERERFTLNVVNDNLAAPSRRRCPTWNTSSSTR